MFASYLLESVQLSGISAQADPGSQALMFTALGVNIFAL